MRGLKQQADSAFNKQYEVASFTDAWIETPSNASEKLEDESHLLQMRGLKLLRSPSLLLAVLSHLLQMRGLKLNFTVLNINIKKSHLLQMRGLKQREGVPAKEADVASFTDAWIETYIYRINTCTYSRIFYRCVD